MKSPATPRRLLVALALLPLAAPAAAQFQSESRKFLEAVRDSKGEDVSAALNKPGVTLVNTRDYSTGETALHIVVKRDDATYLRFLLAKGADPNARDDKGTTPLLLAASLGEDDLIPILTGNHANPNLANSAGETPLIRAVQRRDVDVVQQLLAAGADPDQTDNLAGLSARDYAQRDPRAGAVAKLLAATPKQPRRAVAGPKL